ncbi:ABC transporter ATP-binding protein [Streptomyces sp. ZAF1911]|uniref:ABC transporter ATP-binding protein n=1 Tax=Streptomyces sp. ZAF1911 TaxID=2944129 RepID=UPI00237A867E|nr:ABC transporter ATP-binding protein [Streptomyces sp. ZAF1911]MDD9380509.1 ABC transporter ATP-binding protein [Streptomyces sp. ZAF1911]
MTSARTQAGVGGARGTGEPVPQLHEVSKVYPGASPVVALDKASFTIRGGELVAIVGPSGSGKSMLLQVMGSLDRSTSGTVRIVGDDIAAMSDRALAGLRAGRIGFVFQQFFLARHATALENVADGMLYSGAGRRAPGAGHGERLKAATVALGRVGLAHRAGHRPPELAGGERQRVAIARALAGNPAIVLADEPTGNLDCVNGAAIFALLKELNAEGTTIVVITHDRELAAQMPRRIELLDGRVGCVRPIWPGPPVPGCARGRCGPRCRPWASPSASPRWWR